MYREKFIKSAGPGTLIPERRHVSIAFTNDMTTLVASYYIDDLHALSMLHVCTIQT